MNVRAAVRTLTVAALTAIPNMVVAQAIPVPGQRPSGSVLTLSGVVSLVQDLVNKGIILATIAVFAMIVYAGFKMAMSRGDEKAFGTAKNILKYAIYGALVVFGVGLIVNTIANVAYNPTGALH